MFFMPLYEYSENEIGTIFLKCTHWEKNIESKTHKLFKFYMLIANLMVANENSTLLKFFCILFYFILFIYFCNMQEGLLSVAQMGDSDLLGGRAHLCILF